MIKRVITYVCEQAEKQFGFTVEQTFVVVSAVIASGSFGAIIMGAMVLLL
jgi:hypothetical protein